VELSLRADNSVVICGPDSNKEKIQEFAKGVEKIASEQNFYRGKKLEVAGRIRFLELPAKSWDSVIMDAEIKREIWANTIGFLASKERLARYGILPKRGVLLVGEPGTGKTLVCKALMAEAQCVTCLLASAYGLGEEEYITELYQLAQDLAPSLVIIEDLDIIAQDRMEYGYSRGPALLALLSTLDGIEEHREIVTVATTNHLEVIDKALGQRPSRFDRVIRITLPNLEQRKQFIASICRKILLEEDTRDYVAHGTDRMTPAQIQEVIYSMVIGYAQNGSDDGSCLRFSKEVVDKAIARINGKKQHHLGFTPGDNHNGDKRWNSEVLSQG
jgi:cell division protease FtsH